MIDWGLVLANTIWLAGLAIMLAAFSMAGYSPLAVLRNVWAGIGFLLFCTGMALTAGSWIEQLLWVLLAGCIVFLLARRRTQAIPRDPQEIPLRHAQVKSRTNIRPLQQTAKRIVQFELLLLMLLSPFYLFPQPGLLTALALVALPLLWIIRWIANGYFVPRTPLDWPICLLMVMIMVSLFVTYDPVLSLAKITGLLFGIAAYYAIVDWVKDAQQLKLALIGYSMAGLGLALLGLVGTHWVSKFSLLASLQEKLPALIRGLPGAENGIHSNEVAGALLWIWPVQLALVRASWSSWFSSLRFRTGVKALAIVAAALSGGLLVLAQSRSAFLGLLLSLALLLAVVLPRTRLAALLGGLVVVAVVSLLLYIGPAAIAERMLDSVGTGFSTADNFGSVQLRTEIWSRAIYGIQDFPFTGMGMNTFRRLMPEIYTASFPPDFDLGHAHNNLLQVALDLGLPGLVAYAAIWIESAALLVVAWRRAREAAYKWILAGIVAGLVASAVYGLTDTVALGAKPGIFFWSLLALLVATWKQSISRPAAAQGQGVVLTGEV